MKGSYKNLLTKQFFRENLIIKISEQSICHFTTTNEGIENLLNKYVSECAALSSERLEQIRKEKELIDAENNPDKLLNFLRKDFDTINRFDLTRKVLDLEEEMLPKVIEKLLRSDNDNFIDNSMRLLVQSKDDYSPILFEKYNEIRNPYVKSVVCIIFGLRGGEEIIPWMMNQYYEMKRIYPDENYSQGPLLALSDLKYRFYER